jgi:hypothetical protein
MLSLEESLQREENLEAKRERLRAKKYPTLLISSSDRLARALEFLNRRNRGISSLMKRNRRSKKRG